MKLTDKYISCILNERHYSERTAEIYSGVLDDFVAFISERENSGNAESGSVDDAMLLSYLDRQLIRSYEVKLLGDGNHSPVTVNLHLSVLSGFCSYLVDKGILENNPVSLVAKPKAGKRLPAYLRHESLEDYFDFTDEAAGQEKLEELLACEDKKTVKDLYESRLSRLIVSLLYCLGLRRAELISLDISSMNFDRMVVKVCGKGDKMREIPLIGVLYEEILLYLKAVEALFGRERSLKEPLLVTYSGKRLYPVYVDRTVKKELSRIDGVTGKKSPHVLRHSLATELLNNEADLNSIKELLGHSSLAATQVYTHNSIAKLKNIYESAHPRAKNGGKHGD